MGKVLIVALLVAVIVALGSGMVFLVKDTSDSRRTLHALTWRIALSIAMILVLVLGYYFGWIHPHGVRPQ